MKRNNLRLFVVVLCSVILISGCRRSGKKAETEESMTAGHAVIGTADAAYKLAWKLSASYQILYPGAFVDIMRYPDNWLVDSLLNERAQEIFLDRPLMSAESLAFQKANLKLYTYPVAYYPVFLLVDKDNPVTGMDSLTLRKILVGTINNWKQIGGDDQRIRIYTPPPGEGAFNSINNYFTKLDSVVAKACSTSAQIIEQANGDAGALLIYPYPAEGIPFKKLSFRHGEREIWPDAETILKDPVYPFKIILTYVTTRSKMDVAAGYLTYCVGNTGQRECMNEGYRPAAVPVKIVRVKQ